MFACYNTCDHQCREVWYSVKHLLFPLWRIHFLPKGGLQMISRFVFLIIQHGTENGQMQYITELLVKCICLFRQQLHYCQLKGLTWVVCLTWGIKQNVKYLILFWTLSFIPDQLLCNSSFVILLYFGFYWFCLLNIKKLYN